MHRNTKNPTRRYAPLALAVAFGSVLAGSALAQNAAPPAPNNDEPEKVQSGATDPKVLKTQPIPGLPNGPGASAQSSGAVELASATLQTNKARDLSIRFTSECFVYTQGSNGQTQSQDQTQSQASVTTWVEVDGQPVPIGGSSDSSGEPDDGKVGLCARSQELSSTLPDEAVIDLAVLSQSTHGFNWSALNAEAGEHTIKVMARLDASVDGSGAGNAAAVIGKRTLQVQAVKPSAPAPEEKKPSNG